MSAAPRNVGRNEILKMEIPKFWSQSEKRELEPPGAEGASKKVLVGKLEVMQEDEGPGRRGSRVRRYLDTRG